VVRTNPEIGFSDRYMYRRVDRETSLRTIRVETTAATILLTEAPEPKVRDRQTGEIAKEPSAAKRS
jgi:hypothetical protein